MEISKISNERGGLKIKGRGVDSGQYFPYEQRYLISLYELHVFRKYAIENADTLCPCYSEVGRKTLFSFFVILDLLKLLTAKFNDSCSKLGGAS